MVRYKPSQFTKKELEAIVVVLATDQGIDFLTGGKLNKYKRKAAIAAYRAIVRPVAARAVPSVARTAVGISRLALTNPYVVGGTLLYLAYTERDRIAQALADGAEIVEDPLRQYVGGVKQRTREFLADPVGAFEEGRAERRRFQETFPAIRTAIRRPSAFNKAVSAGMKVVKKAKTYGGKGKIKPSKKAFALVTKIASAKKKKRKAPKSGIRRKIWNAMRGLR
jgi:hypothetical protein